MTLVSRVAKLVHALYLQQDGVTAYRQCLSKQADPDGWAVTVST